MIFKCFRCQKDIEVDEKDMKYYRLVAHKECLEEYKKEVEHLKDTPECIAFLKRFE